MTLQFDPSPYLQVWAARQRQEEQNRPDPNVIGQNILQGLQMLSENRRKKELMDIQRQDLDFKRNQAARESDYKFGRNPEGIMTPTNTPAASRLFPGRNLNPAMPMVDKLNEFMAGNMKPGPDAAQVMPYLGEMERKQFYEKNNPKQIPITQYQIISPDQSGQYPNTPLPAGVKPIMAPRPLSQGRQGTRLNSPDAQAAFNLYETARDGLLSGLEGSMTGPIMGRIPSFTAEQQIAEGGVAAMAPVLKQLFRVAGEGVFTDRDQALLLEMIPTRATRPEARQAQIQNIDNIVKAKLGINSDQNKIPQPGTIEDGYQFIGGNPSDPNSWRPIQ